MNFKSINLISENYQIFESDQTIPSRLVGYSNIEITELSKQYKFELPKILIQLLKLGGHNFFQYYFDGGLPWEANYYVHSNSQRLLERYRKLIESKNLNISELLVVAQSNYAIIFINLMDEKLISYEILLDNKIEISIYKGTLEILIFQIIEYQKNAYLEYLSRKQQGRLLFIQGKDPIYIEEVERQLAKFKIGENWTDCLKEAERKYDEYLANENNIFVPKNTVNIQEIDDDLPF